MFLSCVLVEHQTADDREGKGGFGLGVGLIGAGRREQLGELGEPVVDAGAGEPGESLGVDLGERVDLIKQSEERAVAGVEDHSAQRQHQALEVVRVFLGKMLSAGAEQLAAGVGQAGGDQRITGAQVVHEHPRARYGPEGAMMNTVPENPAQQTPIVIFVHGACVRDADWWWSRMTQPFTERGISTLAVPLPSCGETGDTLGDLADDVKACRRAIAEVDGPVVLCGHSYGGMIITEAGADERVTHLIYITSVMPDAGQSQAELIGTEPAPWLQPGEDTVGVDPQMIRDYFLQDCDPATTEAAVARLTRQSLTPFTQAPREIAWHVTPSTYIVCTEDLATPPEVQRRRVREGTRVVEFAAGHHPFLSRPDAFAQTLAEEVTFMGTLR